jgi:hypothetical protein
VKSTICTAILILTTLLAHAQQAAKAIEMARPAPTSGSSRTLTVADEEDQQLLAAALLQSYASSVNGLLRNLAGQLRTISQHAAAGELTDDEAVRLKLAATRATIARLEEVLKLMKLMSAFEVCSVREIMDLLCRLNDEHPSVPGRKSSRTWLWRPPAATCEAV